MFKKFRDPVSGLTHLFGAIMSIVGLVVLINFSIFQNSPLHVTVFSIFGASLILLYSASSIYHLVTTSEKSIRILRRIDHSMIYILIAGSYTPICLLALKGIFGLVMLTIIWILAIIGILVKNFWFSAPRWISTSFYLIMGWLIIVAIFPLSKTLSTGGLFWLITGGIAYSIGAIIYGTKRPKIFSKYFTFHDIFHIFVLLGSLCHFILMSNYIIYM
ncbi:hemolysin III family protein [Clostridium sporogenes]|uniref:Hemolysin III family protein n=1 Tax=Clostridium botulinum TaxID=1491 RepID=A0A6M0SYG3_CLOBO|nr:hemolysin III family protein [Clostridium sporogenes]NFA60163.1 hemolysin III family protein [Clostridium botulinum]NFI72862.1 hemolysin III family protein [Clostridium sporogenes]NFL73169.1 hemolysin III family protein [Clostridium sporogenes]NFM23364.1 hemolysin III family protein [Clostridium sporogenes]NFP60275.1 hemolysin III family protein [Clostridium sporogenes]